MNIIIPQNLYAGLWAFLLDEKFKNLVQVKPASVIIQEVALPENKNNLYLAPSLTLVKNRELFISSKACISFDGLLSNSYLYFMPDAVTLDELILRGDFSINEIMLSKILFRERFNSEVEIKLDSKTEMEKALHNYLVTGNSNTECNFIEEGISFADEIASLITYPFVDFILVSGSSESITEFNSYYNSIDDKFVENLDELLKKFNLSEEAEEFILLNSNSLGFEMNEENKAGLTELLRLPFYHGIIEDLFELKYI